MADSPTNISIPVNQWVDLYDLSGIPVGSPITVDNIGDTDVYLSVQATQPPIGHDAYVIIKRDGPPYKNALNASGAWAYANVKGGKLSVRRVSPQDGFFIEDTPLDYATEVARNNVPGARLYSIQGRDEGTDVIFKDVWGSSGSLIYPIGVETWEVVSDNANDSGSGTGGRTGIVISLDENFNEQITPFVLNGITPVTLANQHLRPQEFILTSAGSNETNLGTITLRQQGGGLIRSIILPGNSRAFDTHYTIPAGKEGYVLQTFNLFEKNFEGLARLIIRNNSVSDSIWVPAVPVPLYANLVAFNVKAMLAIPEKTDIKGEVSSKVGGGAVTVVAELLIVDGG